MQHRLSQRLQHQVTSLSVQAEEAYEDNRPDFLAVAVRLVGAAPSVLRAPKSPIPPATCYPSAPASPARSTSFRVSAPSSNALPATLLVSSLSATIAGRPSSPSTSLISSAATRGSIRPRLGTGSGLRYGPRHPHLRLHLDRRFIRPGLAHVVGHHPPHGDPASWHSRPCCPSGIERRLSPSRHRRKRVRRSHLGLQQHGRLH